MYNVCGCMARKRWNEYKYVDVLAGCMGVCECKLNANVFGVALLLSACGCACVWCGGDGCVGDTV